MKALVLEIEIWNLGFAAIRGYSSVGRAPALQAGCHRFESGYLHQLYQSFKAQALMFRCSNV